MKHKLLFIFLLLVGALTIALITIPAFVYRQKFGEYLSLSKSDWGSFSDFMGLFVNLSNLIVTLSIAIIIYRFQQIDAKQSEEEIRKELRIEKLISLSGLMTESFSFLDKAIESMEEFNKRVSSSRLVIPSPHSYSDAELNIIVNKIDREVYLFAIYELVNITNGYKIIGKFDALLTNWNNYQNVFKKFREEERKLIKKSSKLGVEIYKSVKRQALKLEQSNKMNTAEYIIFNKCSDTILEIYNDETRDFFLFKDQVYDVLMNFHSSKQYVFKDEHVSLYELVMKAERQLYKIMNLRERYVLVTDSFIASLKPQIQRTKDMAQPILQVAEKLNKERGK